MDKSSWTYLLSLSLLTSASFMFLHWKSKKQKIIYLVQLSLAFLFQIVIEIFFANVPGLEIISYLWLAANVLFFIVYAFLVLRNKK